MTTTTDRIQDFLDEVATHFDDLPPADRDDLLDDLRQHLVELGDDDPDALELELASPRTYAAELRRSTGLPEPGGAGPPGPRVWAAARARLAVRWRRALQHPVVQEVREFLPALRPAWWVVRGWVLVVAAAQLVSGGPWWRHVPVPDRNLVGLLVAAAAVAVSVRLGRDDRDQTRSWRAVDVAARVALVVGVLQAMTSGMAVEYVTVEGANEPWQPAVLRHPDGEPITNLYLFDAEGNPLEEVFVYDGVGRPVEIGDLAEAGFTEIDTAYDRRPDGTPLSNRYPLEQYVVTEEHDARGVGEADQGLLGVREPRTTPDVVVPGAPTSSPAADPSPTPRATRSATPTEQEAGSAEPEDGATPTSAPT